MSSADDRVGLIERITAECHARGVATVGVRALAAAVDLALDHAVRKMNEAFLSEAREWRSRNKTDEGCEWDLAAGWVVGVGGRAWLVRPRPARRR